jgi:hypothetical protein
MGLSLNFKVVPSSPYHTLNFHMTRGVKQKLYLSEPGGKEWISFLTELSGSLKMLIQVPDNFSICLLPSKIYATVILQQLFPSGVHLLPAHPSITYPHPPELIDSGMDERILLPGTIGPGLSWVKNGFILSHDVDLISGHMINMQEFISVKKDRSEIHLCLDISTSFANHPFVYEKLDAYLFNSEFVFGMQSGISFLIIRDPFINLIQQKWIREFYPPESNSDQDHPGILCHREIESLKLFVIKEMCNDLLRRDRKNIYNEIIYKSILISNALERNKAFELMVKNETDRSPNIISVKILGSTEKVRNHFKSSGIQMDEFYMENYGHIFRFGNFPVHSKEQAGYLSDCIASFR